MLARFEVFVDDVLDIGDTDAGHRRIANIGGGTVTGDRLSGRVLRGGADWQAQQADGTMLVETRYVVRTDDDALIHVRATGLRAGERDVLDAVSAGETTVDPSDYYFRTLASFETGSVRYAWLNRVVGVCSVARLPASVVVDVYVVR